MILAQNGLILSPKFWGPPRDLLSPYGETYSEQELASYHFPPNVEENEGRLPDNVITVTRHTTPQDLYFKLHVREFASELEDVIFYPAIAAFAVDPNKKWVDFFAFDAEGMPPVHVARAHSTGKVDYLKKPSELLPL